ncbi:HAD superfamily hydrolase (TIGR01509 family) [Palleronia aestuarii]|uniref:HAD superfamily hydrolase (TIGR01509 family) n=1 Tax=Palleronia aestuarii TaxID=568105 RepID=A0A2W7PTV2_9RHOB|nr:HAD family phosphatase [Palleronia aestuarii]PZX12889.1 HAD superfamily hydrolase (TIGR01509 family) [Palleronia aestuarii]
MQRNGLTDGPDAGAPLRAIAWDIDGTLTDNEPVHLSVFREVCSASGIDLSGLGDDDFRGLHLDDVWTALGSRRPESLTATAWQERITETYCARSDTLEPMPGLHETFEAFRRAGLRQVCVSNSRRRVVDATLAALGIDRLVDFSISVDDVRAGKPAPDPYLEAARRLDLAPGSLAAIEDSATGAASARAAGLRVFGIATEHAAVPGAEATVTRLPDLVALVAGEARVLAGDG